MIEISKCVYFLFAGCSGGFAQRHRDCLDGQIGDPGCSPASAASESDVCNPQDCPG